MTTNMARKLEKTGERMQKQHAFSVVAGLLVVVVQTSVGVAAGPIAAVPLVQSGFQSWDSIPSASNFRNIVTQTAAQSKTSCRFARTKTNFLARCIASQVPSMASTPDDPLKIQSGDYIALALSLDGDTTNPLQYIFFINPKGVKSATSTVARAVVAPWGARVSVTPLTWTADFTVPFSSLQLPPVKAQSWHVGVMRFDRAAGAAYAWPGIPGRDAMSVDGQASIPDMTVE